MTRSSGPLLRVVVATAMVLLGTSTGVWAQNGHPAAATVRGVGPAQSTPIASAPPGSLLTSGGMGLAVTIVVVALGLVVVARRASSSPRR